MYREVNTSLDSTWTNLLLLLTFLPRNAEAITCYGLIGSLDQLIDQCTQARRMSAHANQACHHQQFFFYFSHSLSHWHREHFLLKFLANFCEIPTQVGFVFCFFSSCLLCIVCLICNIVWYIFMYVCMPFYIVQCETLLKQLCVGGWRCYQLLLAQRVHSTRRLMSSF